MCRLAPLLRRIGCVVSADAEARGVRPSCTGCRPPGAEPATHHCLPRLLHILLYLFIVAEQQHNRCWRFAAVGTAGTRSNEHQRREAGECGQCHVVSLRRSPTTYLLYTLYEHFRGNSCPCRHDTMRYRERKCADTIGTVLVPWAGHFQS